MIINYNTYRGKSHKAGHNQSPPGSRALISNLPYLNEKELILLNLALTIGLIIFEGEPPRSQP